MIRTKLIAQHSIYSMDLDEQINDFLKEQEENGWFKRLIDIKFSTCCDEGVIVYLDALIIYEEEEDDD